MGMNIKYHGSNFLMAHGTLSGEFSFNRFLRILAVKFLLLKTKIKKNIFPDLIHTFHDCDGHVMQLERSERN
jgi:hypothetical protein